jgi:hypothetical protein
MVLVVLVCFAECACGLHALCERLDKTWNLEQLLKVKINPTTEHCTCPGLMLPISALGVPLPWAFTTLNLASWVHAAQN